MSPQLQMKGTMLAAEHNWRALAGLAARATNEDPTDGMAWYLDGLAEQGLGDASAALADLQKADRFAPGSLRPTVEMLLAQQYAAQGDRTDLTEVYHELRNDDPSIANFVRQQYGNQLVSTATPAYVNNAVPDVSPRSLSALTAHVRHLWKTDAVPTSVVIMGGENQGYSVVIVYYSRSTRQDEVVRLQGNGETLSFDAHPDSGMLPIPGQFLSIREAIAAARRQGLKGSLDHAFLYRTGRTPQGRSNLVWDLSFGMRFDPARVEAYVLSASELERLKSSANRGDKLTQYQLAMAYATGVTGRIANRESIYWLRRAIQQGSRRAENKLGQFYEYGVGVAADSASAAYWYGQAGAAGFGPAQFNLALLYEAGAGVRQSWTRASQWLQLAARSGLRQAYAELLFVQQPAARAARRRELAIRPGKKCPVGFVGFEPHCVLWVDPAVQDIFSSPPP
jgi:TPR repeat protein